MKPVRILLCLCLVGVLSSPALAASRASASLQGFELTLIDLRPDDGIAPSLSWDGAAGTSGLILSAGGLFDRRDHPLPFEPDRLSLQDKGASAAAASTRSAISPDGSFSGSIRAQGVAVGDTNFIATDYGLAGTGFHLSPWTALSFSALASVDAATTLGFDPVAFEGESAQAYGGWDLVINGVSLGQLATVDASYVQTWNPVTQSVEFAPEAASLTRALSSRFDNASDDSVAGYGYIYALANGSSISAVPEPSAAAMLLAGLLVVGALGARDGRRQTGRAG